jgi:hypothetical protein
LSEKKLTTKIRKVPYMCVTPGALHARFHSQFAAVNERSKGEARPDHIMSLISSYPLVDQETGMVLHTLDVEHAPNAC